VENGINGVENGINGVENGIYNRCKYWYDSLL